MVKTNPASPWHSLRLLPACLPFLYLLPAGKAGAAPVYEAVAAFGSGPLYPESLLTPHTDGTFFGTTSGGGSYGFGTIFQMTATGTITRTVEFTSNGTTNKGAKPYAPLIRHSNGIYYGTTGSGGTGNLGTVFAFNTDGTVTSLVQFTGKSGNYKGSSPVGALVEGADGNLYGTTYAGGTDDAGTVFSLTPAGTFTTLVQFTGNGSTNKGKGPAAPLTQDGTNFYGTTTAGGTGDSGTVFRVSTTGSLTTLVNFTGNGDSNKGANPQSRLIKKDSYLYGTTLEGGTSDRGTIFRVATNGTLSTLVHMNGFDGNGSNGAGPLDVTMGTDGYLYGTTQAGGLNGAGTVFRANLTGGFVTRFHFSGPDGMSPAAGLTQGTDGNFYGTTRAGGPGGAQGFGTAFKITPAGDLTTLNVFTGDGPGAKGSSLNAGLVADGQSGFLGTTSGGGTSGAGTVFRVSPDGTITTVIEFTGKTGANKGTSPVAGLYRKPDGNFYGTTRTGGTGDFGTIFQLTPAGVMTTVVEFTGTTGSRKGAYPSGALVRAGDGNFYGTTERGGVNNRGTVFRLTAGGTFTTMVDFTGTSGGALGASPTGTLTVGTDGNLYGLTAIGGDTLIDQITFEPLAPNGAGTVFRLTTGGTFTSLAQLTGKTGARLGTIPSGGLLSASDGSLYGTTTAGGSAGSGTLFKITQAGVFTSLYEFKGTGTVKGISPNGTLIEADDGNFYGTTLSGGTSGGGTIFRLTPGGTVTTLFEFTGSSGAVPGGSPANGLSLASFTDGNLYGTTSAGGVTSAGTPAGGGQIFRIRFGATPVTKAATAAAGSNATLNGSIRPNGNITTVTFQYGTDPALATSTTVNAGTSTAGTAAEDFNTVLTGLTPGTPYYFRIVGVNAANDTPQRGAILSFTPGVLSDLEKWRQLWFGTTGDTGNAANLFDADGDGIVNLVEYAFGLNPTQASSSQLPLPVLNGGNLEIAFPTPAGVSGIRYDVEWSPTMEEGSWNFADDTGTSPGHLFSIPAGTEGKLFTRFKISILGAD